MTSKHLTSVLVFALLAGCYGNAAGTGTGTGTGTASGAPTTQASAGDTGLPCDVQKVLADNCWSCHGSTPAKGAPTSLVTYDNLAAPASGGKTIAQLVVERMRDAKSPMPPSGGVAEADIATVEAWVAGGAAQASCTDGVTGDLNIYDTPLVCSSKKTWTSGNHGSADMRPGRACITCHDTDSEAPELNVAGTVYPTAHEPDDCNGKAGVSVVITDAKGKTYTAKVSATSGNFNFGRNVITMPYKAKVVDASGKVRAMSAEQKSSDCNACHTQDGTKDAPGRIMAP